MSVRCGQFFSTDSVTGLGRIFAVLEFFF
jgi:hypothetical protein